MISSRRQFLLAAGSVAVLAACGDDGPSGAATASNPTTSAPGPDDGEVLPEGFFVVQRFPNHPVFTPGECRLPVSFAGSQNLLNNGPATINGWIDDFNGERVTDFVGIRRNEGIAIPYWEVRVQIEKAVIHTMRFDGDDGFGATFEIYDEGDVVSPLTGSKLPGFETPTADNHRGVEPYCSLLPNPCPLHDITLTEALAGGKPVAYMVGTPAHCTTGTCGPGLDFLVAERQRLGDKVLMVHADVYADDAATVVAPAVDALKVKYEPLIYLCSADGTIVDRLDGVWDASELRERLDLLVAG